MTGFNFDMTAGTSQTHQSLQGNQIHTVTFDGCEARNIQGKQDTTQTYKVLDIKFSNSTGTFVDTIWQPREEDYKDTVGSNGKPIPSNVMAMIYKFKHLIDAVNPELGKKIDKKEASIAAPDWDSLRQLMVKATQPGVGTETKIKLVTNNKGEARFPFFARYNSSGQFFMGTNFIGNNIAWSRYELEQIQKAAEAKPVAVDSFGPSDMAAGITPVAQPESSIDFNF